MITNYRTIKLRPSTINLLKEDEPEIFFIGKKGSLINGLEEGEKYLLSKEGFFIKIEINEQRHHSHFLNAK